MIRCKNCGYEYDYTGKSCPVCSAAPIIDLSDKETTVRELKRATEEKNQKKIYFCRHLLADAGDVESMREFAKAVEKNAKDGEDIDTAMAYYKKAAEKNDPYSAYKFSRLIGRSSEEASRFWLRYSAVLGSIHSYPEAAELFSSEGKEEIAAYYVSRAAACDDTLSIVNMAKRWCEGIGVEPNPAYARWYLDKLTLPPISAIKLAHKLRMTEPSEPPRLSFPSYDKYIRLLADNAKKLGFFTAYFYLESALANAGDFNAALAVGILLAEGKGCEKDTERGISLIESAVLRGNPAAALYLAEEYRRGAILDKDLNTAIKYYKKAAELGYPAAYEKIADIYRESDSVGKHIGRIIELYELAAAGGSESAEAKARELIRAREDFYLEAYNIINLKQKVTKEEAFTAYRSAAISTAMGDARAALLLAKCYAFGFGTEKSRATAFYWYKHAADSGCADALLPLGLCYSRGFGTEFSYKLAVKFLTEADKAGLKGAKEELETVYKRRMKKMVRSLYANAMELIHQKKFSEAARLLSSFESLAYPKAIYTLGCLYEFGRGVTHSDRIRAEKYYEKAFIGNDMYGSFKDPNSNYKLTILRMIR